MTEYLILVLAICLLLLGLLLVLFPDLLERFERALNRPVGERPVLSLRAGIPGERDIERALNRPVLMKSIYWDQWIRRQPRTLGALLLAAAGICIAVING